jgi:hypothetical protein
MTGFSSRFVPMLTHLSGLNIAQIASNAGMARKRHGRGEAFFDLSNDCASSTRRLRLERLTSTVSRSCAAVTD